jgi:4'-phosphopantetheinyl transferase
MLYFDKYNRPYQKENQDLDFNISHSGEWVVCGISDSGRVGIDVEKIKPISLDIAKNYFKGNEYETIVKRDGKEKLSCFFHFWTLKEAYLKAEGSTFLIPLDKFWFDISNFSNPQFSCMKNFYYTLNYKFNSYRIDNGYILSLCCKCKNIKNNPYTLLQFEDIVDFYSKFIYYY